MADETTSSKGAVFVVTRLISAFCAVVLLFVVVLSGNMIALTAALVICSTLGVFELFKVFGFLDKPVLVVCSMLMAACVILNQYINPTIIMAAFFVYVLILVCHMLKFNGVFSFSDAATSAFGVVYVSVPLYMLLGLRCQDNGFWLLWIALGGAWVTDSFAYFTGMLFGKHKLCPKISPKKTIEGSVGGTVFTVGIGLLFGYLVSKYAGVGVNYINLGVLSLICAIVSQLGDLTASTIKREKGIKDFGNLMPGHGGFMDRFDSTLFVAPAVFIFNGIFTVFF